MSSPATKRILIVEDNLALVAVLRRCLEDAGFGVAVAGTGLQAQELFRRKRFDIVVTDYQMPKMNGEELVRSLRQGPFNSDVGVLLVTGKGLELDTEQLRRDLGVFEVISKPFGPRHLINVVHNCLAQEREPAGGCR